MGNSDRVSLQAGYLLHYRVHRDTSFIVDMFTLNHGRVSMLARGGRSAKPATRALYQPFRPLLVSWMGSRELRTLIGIEDSGAALELQNRALACAYYINELLLRLLGKAQAYQTLFAQYSLSLAELGASAEFEPILRRFEVQLLESLGLLPDLVHSAAGGDAVDPLQQYRFYPSNATAVAVKPDTNLWGQKPDNINDATVHADGVTREEGVLLSGATLHAVLALDFSDSVVREQSKRLMRALLGLHLGGQPLKSRSLFDALAPTR